MTRITFVVAAAAVAVWFYVALQAFRLMHG
jgi:hypothetical protein